MFLLAGVSYYKTAAPPVIDLGDTAVTDAERAFLRSFYLDGLGEFGYRNGLDLSGLRIEGPRRRRARPPGPADCAPAPGRPLVPFGGGIDSIVTVEHGPAARRRPRCSSWAGPGDRFDGHRGARRGHRAAHRPGRARDRPAAAPLRANWASSTATSR